MSKLLLSAVFVATVGLSGITSAGSVFEGVATVIDGDTIEIAGQRIRLAAVDAPESSQTCDRGDGQLWRCGQTSALALSSFIGRRTVRCDEEDRDRYGRSVATCFVGGTEINSWLVSNGLAIEYLQYSGGRYTDIERGARDSGMGIWSSDFENPADYRKKKRN